MNKRQNNVLKNVDLTILEGEMTAVMGPSGSGKSTLLYCVSGMDRVTAGEIVFNGGDTARLRDKELARGNLAVPIPEEESRYFGKFTWGVNLLREKIEQFVSEITKAASEDFMSFEVRQGKVFLSQVLPRLHARYAPQLAVSGTEFAFGQYDDCILSCDADRLAGCLQNFIENAIKYGDGKRIAIGFEKMDGCELEEKGCRSSLTASTAEIMPARSRATGWGCSSASA